MNNYLQSILISLLFLVLPILTNAQNFETPAVRPPTGLSGHAGITKMYLQWNPNLETGIAGYIVYRAMDKGTFSPVNDAPVTTTSFIDKVPKSAVRWSYKIKAILSNNDKSDYSNTLTMILSKGKTPEVKEGAATFSFPGNKDISVQNAIRVTFHNGHSIIFDKDLVRLRDWTSKEGTHLLYPKPYGNPVDITKMNNWGFPEPAEATSVRPALPPQYNLDYNTPGKATYLGHTISDDRITFAYSIPLEGAEKALLWETYWPINRKMRSNGSQYSGMARQIEMQMPSSYKDGYALCLNDGFGQNGSCDKAVSYMVGWDSPGLTTTKWTKDVAIKSVDLRKLREFHPSQSTLQSRPYMFMSFPKGHLVLGAQKYYYSTGYSMTNYVDQGKDGIWPNFFTECDKSGERFTVETFEYLWSPDVTVKAPQQFIDASFYYRRYLAGLYKLIPHHLIMAYAWDYWGPSKGLRDKPMDVRLQALRDWGKEYAAKAVAIGADYIGGAHTLWTSGPEAVPDEIRLDPNHEINRAIADMTASMKGKNIGFGYWIRPEFIRVNHEDIFKPTIVSNESRKMNNGYQYDDTTYPDLRAIMLKNGLPLVRDNRDTWIRKGRDGSGTSSLETPYDWVPASLTVPGGLYDKLIYPNFVMQKELGYTSMFFDGGPASMQGIDYTGGVARACQPYWWRLISDIYRLGMNVHGEIDAGFGGACVAGGSRLDEAARDHFWAFSHISIRGNRDGYMNKWFTARERHTCCQLYVSANIDLNSSKDHGDVLRYFKKFMEKNGHPDGIALEGLRQENEKWIWDKVWWEYNDGRRVQYPNFEEIIYL